MATRPAQFAAAPFGRRSRRLCPRRELRSKRRNRRSLPSRRRPSRCRPSRCRCCRSRPGRRKPHFEYGKAWWHYVELVRRFARCLDTNDVRVIGHYIVDTPLPSEKLPMPAVALAIPGVTFALRFDFGVWSVQHEMKEWVVSVRRRSPYLGPLVGLFEQTRDLRAEGMSGLMPDWLFGSYRENQAAFTCVLGDEQPESVKSGLNKV